MPGTPRVDGVFEPAFLERLRQDQDHPDWCDGREDKELAARVAAATAFAREHGVTQEVNVLRLIDLQLRPGFAVPLSGYPHYRLTQRGLDEATRVRNFAFALTQPQNPVVIALDTALDALERGDKSHRSASG